MSQRSSWFILLPLVLVLCLLACSSDSEFNPIASSYLDPPRVSGLWVYSAGGAYLGSWGVPWIRTAREEAGKLSGMPPLIAYPNPAPKPMPSTTIAFSVPEPSRVWLWVVRAEGPSEIETALTRAAGGEYVRPEGGPVAVLIDGESKEPGFTVVEWTLNAGASEIGFYRVTLVAQTASGEIFRDYFDLLYWIGGNCELAPADLRPYLFCDEQ